MHLHSQTSGVASTPSGWSQHPQVTTGATLQPHGVQQPWAPGKEQTEVVSQPHHANNGNGIQFQPQTANSHVASKPTTASSQSLHQAYMQVVQNAPKQVSQPPSQILQSQPPGRLSNDLESQQALSLQQAYLSATKTATGTYHGTAAAANSVVAEPIGGTVISVKSSTIPATSQASATNYSLKATEMPDFLSGFYQAAEQKIHPKVSATAPVDYTPAFASKSFDDFHPLLGKHLQPISSKKSADGHLSRDSALNFPGRETIAAAVSNSANLASTLQPPVGHPNHQSAAMNKTTEGLKSDSLPNSNLLAKSFNEALSQANTKSITPNSLGADFYSMFAQESAIAASQHSAYTGGNEMEPYALHTLQESVIPTSLLRPMHAQNVVSEPSITSGSDRGTEEIDESPGETAAASGVSDNASNDSYGTNSEYSRSRKKARTSYAASARRTQSFES